MVLSPRSASSATVALNLSEKFRRFVSLVSIRSWWIHLSTLSKFSGPLQFPVSDIPVLFITGTEDRNTPGELAFAYYEALEAPA